MTLRLPRTVLAVAVSFVCALAVFTLPRFAWNTIQAAGRRPAAPVTTPQGTSSLPPPAPPAPPPRPAGQRLTGVLGIAFILGLGFALSRNLLVSVACLFLTGFSMVSYTSVINTTIQNAVPDDLRELHDRLQRELGGTRRAGR